MIEKLEKIKAKALKAIEECNDETSINNTKSEYLGKKSEFNKIMSDMCTLSNEEKKEVGAKSNEIRTIINDALESRLKAIKEAILNERLEKDKIDLTLPSRKFKTGSKHPINIVIEEIEDLFISMGYDVVDGPEVETDKVCFEMLNVPKGHPARDAQDTFYINDEMLLRTQTSTMQIRSMLANVDKKPFKLICPGKVYRRDDDATHSHQFTQIEGLVVGENISLSDLKGTLETLCKKLFGNDREIRFRASYFPFTEPSYEVDVSCFVCNSKGCSLCKNTGWIEILGSGMVHPNVLNGCGFDSSKYTGFAFGLGVERVAMLKYGINDIRLFYTNDYRFLKNFDRKEI
ncbi:MAG: phenylalanine--tRNA ligase subunit alpha [Tenericutes bacterium]|nr:phenylalanine--tRNA ligase subunit alpha [Mycoplasmatota bacterium]